MLWKNSLSLVGRQSRKICNYRRLHNRYQMLRDSFSVAREEAAGGKETERRERPQALFQSL
jgi:hypothetical protein